MATLPPWIATKFYLADGVTPNAGGKVFTYAPGTTTKKTTYVSESGAANTNPIVLNSAGEANLWFGAGGYKVVNAPSTDTDPPSAAIKTWDDINLSASTGLEYGVVETNDALKALDEGAFDTVQRLGYYSANGVGSGLYYWDATSTASNNNGTVIVPNVSDGTGRWILIQSEPIKVSQFGGRGLSSGEDTPALIAAYQSFAGAEGKLIIDNSLILSSNVTIPANVEVEVINGAVISGAYTLTINGPFECGRYQCFASTVTVVFGEGAVSYVYPQWRGAAGDGVTDDSDALIWSLSHATTTSAVYRTPGADWGGYKYLFTKRIMVFSRVLCNQTKLIASGNGNNFKMATNPFAASPNGPQNAGVDSCVFVMDGGSIHGLTIVADTTLDVVGNAGIWLCVVQEVYGYNPVQNMRIDGSAANRNLNGLTARYCTTSTIGNVGGNYLTHGFRAFNGNLNTYKDLYFQHIANVSGNKPFEFNTIGDCIVENCWHEQGGDQLEPFKFDSCGRIFVTNLEVGEPTTGVSAGQTGVRIVSCSDMEFRALNVAVDSWGSGARSRVTGSSSRILFDDTYNAKADTYGKFGTRPYTNLIKGRITLPCGLDLGDTLQKFFIGYIPFGATISVSMSSKSGALTTPAIDIYRLSAGAYSNRGTLTYASYTNAGDIKTLTLAIDQSAEYYLSPSAGAGIVDIEWEYNNTNGNAFA